jgi:hypothetical protein
MAAHGKSFYKLTNQQAPLSGLFIVLSCSDFYDNEDIVMAGAKKGTRGKTGKTTKK